MTLALTDLNRATTAAYRACQMNGGCIPSDTIVRRNFPARDLELPTCQRCGVPIGAPKKVSWSTGAPRGPKMPG